MCGVDVNFSTFIVRSSQSTVAYFLTIIIGVFLCQVELQKKIQSSNMLNQARLKVRNFVYIADKYSVDQYYLDVVSLNFYIFIR